MTYLSRALVIFAAGVLLGGCKQTAEAQPATADIQFNVISSAPDQVTGGDVLVAVRGLDDRRPPGFLLNGRPVQPKASWSRHGRSEFLLEGLDTGANTLALASADGKELRVLKLINHPTTGPIFSGPQQYPFVCTSVLEWDVQPVVDSKEAGFPVRNEAGEVIGYSKDCTVEPFVEFHYMSEDGEYKKLPDDGSRPEDMVTTTLTDGREVDFIVRWERGTLNRFLYSIASLAELGDVPEEPGTRNWNGRLLYYFQGGVGIGHSQGRMDPGRALTAGPLGQGYAVAYSTGTRTSTHYNLQVGGETALMVKERFIERFGQPLYTVGVGGSGGAIQQYVYSQNHPGLIDAGVPQYSYPDQVTQSIHVGDCELLEHYMDVTDRENPRWQTTKNRSLLVGLNATDDHPDPLADAKRQLGYSTAPGSTECIPGWRGLSQLTMNPHYGRAREQEKMVPAEVMQNVNWTHYDDLRNIYGLDAEGWPRVGWDNVGVQYGLRSMVDGHITPEEFLHLNEKIGGWKKPAEMVQEGYPYLGEMSPENFDPWSRRNMNLAKNDSAPAPRTEGDLQAIQSVYESGMVFRGQLDIPLIDWRHYLEDELDMHNTHQSFSTRQRLLNTMGHADGQVIWFTDARPERSFDQTPQALEVLHEWLMNIRANPNRSLAENRPAAAVDSCFATDGSLIASGADVWAGILDDREPGVCTEKFPIYSTSRMIAGGPIEGSIFKCALKPVDLALSDGTYAPWTPSAAEITRLKRIFPQGVCDYSKPDQGRPKNLEG
ncbi:hypothetical protein F6455_00820 [Proteobacteria bacterium 005FR1]|nr:hypothetical protein [Proteobacteria bacterium 005FR1]